MTGAAKQALRERIMQSMAEGCIASWIEIAAARRRMHTLPFDGGLSQKGRLEYHEHLKTLIHEHRVNTMMTRAVKDSWA